MHHNGRWGESLDFAKGLPILIAGKGTHEEGGCEISPVEVSGEEGGIVIKGGGQFFTR